jgi:hypothetical protein
MPTPKIRPAFLRTTFNKSLSNAPKHSMSVGLGSAAPLMQRTTERRWRPE